MTTTGFADLFASYPPAVRPQGGIVDACGAGGLSGARLYRYRSVHGEMVLRRWPGDGSDQARIERTHEWMARGADLGFIPNPIRDLAGASLKPWAGGLWEVAPWLAGSAHLQSPPDDGPLITATAGLALFHSRLADLSEPGRSPGLARRLETVIALQNGGFSLLATAVQKAGPRTPVHDQALCYIDHARALAPALVDPLRVAADRVIRLQPCLRDARPEHFLFQDAPAGLRLSGLVDFGAMDVDAVAGDPARLFSEWRVRDPGRRSRALAAYGQVRPLEADQAALIEIFEQTAALLGGERWIRWRFLEGKTFDDPDAPLKGLTRALERLEWLGRSLTPSGSEGWNRS